MNNNAIVTGSRSNYNELRMSNSKTQHCFFVLSREGGDCKVPSPQGERVRVRIKTSKKAVALTHV